jgi:K+-transporting ATPase c subunit
MIGKSLKIAFRFTLVTTLLLGIGYPLLVTGFRAVALKSRLTAS